MNNFRNVNEVFPILDLIRRELKKNNFDNDREYFDRLSENESQDVKEVQVFRQSGGMELISAVAITYFDGTFETLTLNRGLTPPVPDTVEDYDYINNHMLVGFEIEVKAPYGDKRLRGKTIREGGYGRITGLSMTVL